MPSLWITLKEAREMSKKSPEGCSSVDFLGCLENGEIEAKTLYLERLTAFPDGSKPPVHPPHQQTEKSFEQSHIVLQPGLWQNPSTVIEFDKSIATFVEGDVEYVTDTILVRREDVERLWPPRAPPKNKGGREPKWDWEGAMMAMGLHIFVNGRPSSQAELEKLVQGWFIDRFDQAPAESLIREHVEPFYQAIVNSIPEKG